MSFNTVYNKYAGKFEQLIKEADAVAPPPPNAGANMTAQPAPGGNVPAPAPAVQPPPVASKGPSPEMVVDLVDLARKALLMDPKNEMDEDIRQELVAVDKVDENNAEDILQKIRTVVDKIKAVPPADTE